MTQCCCRDAVLSVVPGSMIIVLLWLCVTLLVASSPMFLHAAILRVRFSLGSVDLSLSPCRQLDGWLGRDGYRDVSRAHWRFRCWPVD